MLRRLDASARRYAQKICDREAPMAEIELCAHCHMHNILTRAVRTPGWQEGRRCVDFTLRRHTGAWLRRSAIPSGSALRSASRSEKLTSSEKLPAESLRLGRGCASFKGARDGSRSHRRY